jgi:hypothetical protein
MKNYLSDKMLITYPAGITTTTIFREQVRVLVRLSHIQNDRRAGSQAETSLTGG